MYEPVPDVVFRPAQALRDLTRLESLPPKVTRAFESLRLDPAITQVRMTLREVFVMDNRDPGKGDIYLVTVVTDNLSADPFAMTVKSFEDIHDNEKLQIGPSGLTIYRNPEGTVPRFIDYRILVAESDQEMRDAGAVLDAIREDKGYQEIRDSLSAIAGAANPAMALYVNAADYLIGIIAKVLKMNRDDQLMYVAGSFDDKFDDLGVKYGLVPHKNQYAKVSYQVEAL